MQKKEGSIDNNTWMLMFAGGLGTAFFLLFTDIGREILAKIGFTNEGGGGWPSLADLIGESPYEFYPYVPPQPEENPSGIPSPFREPDYVRNPNPYWLADQPYTYTGGTTVPYAHPYAAENLVEGIPDYSPQEPNPVMEWLGKLFRGESA